MVGWFLVIIFSMQGLLTLQTGTGTTIGDEIEANALNQTFCKERQRENKLIVGSVKGNVGHTESVAGLAGLIKTVLMLEKKMIPPNATFMKMSSKIPLEAWGIEVSFLDSYRICFIIISSGI